MSSSEAKNVLTEKNVSLLSATSVAGVVSAAVVAALCGYLDCRKERKSLNAFRALRKLRLSLKPKQQQPSAAAFCMFAPFAAAVVSAGIVFAAAPDWQQSREQAK